MMRVLHCQEHSPGVVVASEARSATGEPPNHTHAQLQAV